MLLYLLVVPACALFCLSLPIVLIWNKKLSKHAMKRHMRVQLVSFASVCMGIILLQWIANPVFAASDIAGTNAQGMGFLAAALSAGLSALGAGIAVASAAPAAIGAFSENSKNFSKAMIFVALGEGVAIYGLLIAILIINAL